MKIFWILTVLFIMNACNSDDDIVPSVSIESIQIEEGNTINNLEIALTLSNTVDYDLSVDVRTIDGTAIKGLDYTELNEVIIFNAGEQEATFTIQIIGDNIPEYTEIFSIRLETVSYTHLTLPTIYSV